jgi:hypothetical protein
MSFMRTTSSPAPRESTIAEIRALCADTSRPSDTWLNLRMIKRRLELAGMTISIPDGIRGWTKETLCRELARAFKISEQEMRTAATLSDGVLGDPAEWPAMLFDPIERRVITNPTFYVTDDFRVHAFQSSKVNHEYYAKDNAKQPGTGRAIFGIIEHPEGVSIEEINKHYRALLKLYVISRYGIDHVPMDTDSPGETPDSNQWVRDEWVQRGGVDDWVRDPVEWPAMLFDPIERRVITNPTFYVTDDYRVHAFQSSEANRKYYAKDNAKQPGTGRAIISIVENAEEVSVEEYTKHYRALMKLYMISRYGIDRIPRKIMDELEIEKSVMESTTDAPNEKLTNGDLFMNVNGRNILLLGETHDTDDTEAEQSIRSAKLKRLFDKYLQTASQIPACVDIFIENDTLHVAGSVRGSGHRLPSLFVAPASSPMRCSLVNLTDYLLESSTEPGIRDVLRLHVVDIRQHPELDSLFWTSSGLQPFPERNIPALGFLALNKHWGEMIADTTAFPLIPVAEGDGKNRDTPAVSEMYERWKEVYPESRVQIENVYAAVAKVPIMIHGLGLMTNLAKNVKKLLQRTVVQRGVTLKGRTRILQIREPLLQKRERVLEPLAKLFNIFVEYIRTGDETTPKYTLVMVGMFMMDFYTMFRMLVKDFSGYADRSPRVCRDDPPTFIMFYGGGAHVDVYRFVISRWNGQKTPTFSWQHPDDVEKKVADTRTISLFFQQPQPKEEAR